MSTFGTVYMFTIKRMLSSVLLLSHSTRFINIVIVEGIGWCSVRPSQRVVGSNPTKNKLGGINFMPKAKLDFSSLSCSSKITFCERCRTVSGCVAIHKHSFPFLSTALDHGPSGQRCHEYPSYSEC